jgi:hypothetical protein
MVEDGIVSFQVVVPALRDKRLASHCWHTKSTPNFIRQRMSNRLQNVQSRVGKEFPSKVEERGITRRRKFL